jgi:hypothetical protein
MNSGDSEWHFDTDPVDYYDGTCWVESRLRSRGGELLVVVGWSLQQERLWKEDDDGSMVVWLLDNIDWQDFRDEYRPGIGREEWERICG